MVFQELSTGLESTAIYKRSAKEEIEMRKCVKKELKRHSYLTMSKNVSTPE